MAQDIPLVTLSNAIADLAETSGHAVVQVQGRRRPGTGLVYTSDVVLTTVRALGGEDGLHIRRADGETLDAQLAGWDPTTNLAVLRVPKLGLTPLTPAAAPARVGHIAIALARSWSNALTVSAGVVSVIGGPLPTGRRRAIDRILRTTAPMHDGFSGGAFLDAAGGLIGVATAARIRGLGVVIPVEIAWHTAATLLEHGQLKRGYLGIATQPVQVRAADDDTEERPALLVVTVSSGSPASAAGVIVGDVLLEFDGHALGSPEDLLDLLGGRAGHAATLGLLRGGRRQDTMVTVGERPGARE
jgi:serine protease Do